MKSTWMGIACALAIVAGCASRPTDGPGSGYGANYVPLVQATDVPAATYDADVAACQKTARSYTFATPDEHRDALFVLNAVTLGAAASMPAGWVPRLASTGTTWGLNNGFEYGVYSPQRAAFHARQESAIANCMARKGYLNADPSVAVTWTPTPAAAVTALRRTGVDTYNAERVAKNMQCTAEPFAKLIDKGPGFERHAVFCSNGRALVVRCEFGNCRAG
ncbi:MAG: hypothetical protein REJ24_13420 [Rhodocyclaceae bacterium]|nr:hypothetical protein [Pseudomonadota bacterium]MDQ7973563.1 hypothetical protein [Rhodocyclaceae bacterium]MDQ8001850.1 hypothetical protein [Pseudomonadota bacterium]MDQ8017623.1 hypothetical protein [Pseudomonadota bacterium]